MEEEEEREEKMTMRTMRTKKKKGEWEGKVLWPLMSWCGNEDEDENGNDSSDWNVEIENVEAENFV